MVPGDPAYLFSGSPIRQSPSLGKSQNDDGHYHRSGSALSRPVLAPVDNPHRLGPDPFAFLLGRFLPTEVQDKRPVLVGEDTQVQAAFLRLGFHHPGDRLEFRRVALHGSYPGLIDAAMALAREPPVIVAPA